MVLLSTNLKTFWLTKKEECESKNTPALHITFKSRHTHFQPLVEGETVVFIAADLLGVCVCGFDVCFDSWCTSPAAMNINERLQWTAAPRGPAPSDYITSLRLDCWPKNSQSTLGKLPIPRYNSSQNATQTHMRSKRKKKIHWYCFRHARSLSLTHTHTHSSLNLLCGHDEMDPIYPTRRAQQSLPTV